MAAVCCPSHTSDDPATAPSASCRRHVARRAAAVACRGGASRTRALVIMSTAYRAVGWNRQKRRYDAAILIGGPRISQRVCRRWVSDRHNATVETLIIRACGTCAALLLHVVLAIGPLCRLDPRFLPLLYNRRHLGVTTFLSARPTARSRRSVSRAWRREPVVSVLVTSCDYDSLADFPFQHLGCRARHPVPHGATSHDFWLRSLSPPVWKTLHMLVYVAYAWWSPTWHSVRCRRNAPRLPADCCLQAWRLVARAACRRGGPRGRRDDRSSRALLRPGSSMCAPSDDIVERRATDGLSCPVSASRYFATTARCRPSRTCAVIRTDRSAKARLSAAASSAHGMDTSTSRRPAAHQRRSLRGCRRSQCGSSVGACWSNPAPHPPGTHVEPARVDVPQPREAGLVNDEFYIGYEPDMPARLAKRIRRVARGLVALALVTPAVLVFTEGRFAPGVFEYGRVRTFSGRIVAFPYPALMADDVTGAARAYWLVGPGKHGAADIVRGRDGQHVQLSGSLIERGGDAMIEASQAVSSRSAAAPLPSSPCVHSAPWSSKVRSWTASAILA